MCITFTPKLVFNLTLSFVTGDAMVERLRRDRMSGVNDRLPMSRSGPSRNQQLVSNQGVFSPGTAVLDLHNGTSPFRSVHNDPQLPWQPVIVEYFVRRVFQGDQGARRGDSVDRFGGVLQEKGGVFQRDQGQAVLESGRASRTVESDVDDSL